MHTLHYMMKNQVKLKTLKLFLTVQSHPEKKTTSKPADIS